MLRMATLLVLFATFSTSAAPLTVEEAKKGWISLFDGETTYGWKVEGDAVVKDGKLIIGGEKESKITSTTVFDTFDLQFDFESGGTGQLRAAGANRGLTQLQQGQLHIANFKVEREGDSQDLDFTVKTDMGDFMNFQSFRAPPERHPIVFTVPAGKKLVLTRVQIQPLALKSIFNGKDLTGWKIFPDRKSKFVVTPEGAINVKDGPGDLQTVDQYGDFILQLECISNGEYLNSGIFFRGIPNEYQQGYEAQIRNQWVEKDRNKPVDFGTGAIYRRQPARKVVSNDKEWFTMTLIAHGNHMATWVNGYQVADFFDDRPEADNGRKGTKLGKGVISIQGHDPTTDLSFRNLKIVELPPAKK